ncbi:MAG TPA: ABC transporter ATP-binding protein [Gammaproteobacteria bacterium]|nr:ABC transporter ATP-binding protein [Gammaproteobacteria bacterium]
MLALEDVHASYGRVEALKGVSLEVRRGEIVTLIGANGAGKTTILMSICGEPTPTQGRIRFDGEEIQGLPTPTIMRRRLAIVPEGRRIFSGLTVEENLALGGFHQSPEERAAAAEEVYALFPRLKERRRQRGGTLSGGEQQMLAIGRALMSRPQLLLLDEPSLGLAPLVIARIFEVLEEIRQAGTTVFLVEQNAYRALQLADRAYVLENGKIVMSGEGRELLESDQIRRAYLGA